MTPFLQSVATDLYSKYKTDISDVCLIFPGKRAGIFFSRHLSQMLDKPIWLPPLKTISELMTELSGLHLADPIILISHLYRIYKDVQKTDETFDNFYAWGEILLNDFDDIDKYLVDTKQLFQNLNDIKEIESKFTLPEEQLEIIKTFWKNVNIYESGPYKEEFLSIWARLYTIYTNFKEKLRNNGIAYEGMVYRYVYELIYSGKKMPLPYNKFAIVGFNALNECEKAFFKYLDGTGKAHFYWDYDNYYVENSWHEAGFFIRDNLKTFPQSFHADLKVENLKSSKNIRMAGIPSGIGQAKLIPDILNDWRTSGIDLTDTAVILADENLLIPVLSSIPEDIKEVNVTLGYPFRLTPVKSFIESIIALQRSIRTQKNNIKFYHRDVAALLNHPYVQSICNDEANVIKRTIIQNNLVFLEETDLHKNDYLKQIFRQVQTGMEFTQYLLQIGFATVNSIRNKQEKNREHDFHIEYWFTLLSSLNRLVEILKSGDIDTGLQVIFKIIRSIASGLSVPFKGEPLSGFQVMGVLETRTLDFKNLIILSANEGVLPKTEASSSYIPYNLRKGFGLPTIEHQDAIFAYYFYRLIQRAENIALLYNSQAINNTGEMSRFLYQLKYEPLFDPKELTLNFTVTLPDEKNIVIHKDQEIMDVLMRYTEPGSGLYFTPTALSSYLECTLRFYFRYLIKIKEKEEITEDVDGSMFGKLLHSAMEYIYHPLIGYIVNAKEIEDKLKEDTIRKAVLHAFSKEYFKSEKTIDELHGKNIIVFEVLKKYVKAILEKDVKRVPFRVVALEERYKSLFKIQVASGNYEITIGGVFDRLDGDDSNIRIFDYKTGVVETLCSSLEQIFDRSGNVKRAAPVFQALLYSLVLSKQQGFQDVKITPGLYALRLIFEHDFDPSLYVGKEKVEDFSQVKDEFSANLKKLLEEIYNPEIPFAKVDDKSKCEYCAYKMICHR